MRIACVTSSWPTAENPSAGAFVREHARLLEAAGHEVTVFTWRPGTYAEDVRVVAPLGRRSVFAGSGAPDALERAPWRVVEGPVVLGSMIAALAAEPAFDLYLGHWLVPGGLAARIAGAMRARPSAVVGHSAGVHALRALPRTVGAPLMRRVVRSGSTTVPSAALAARVRAWCPERVVDVLPMGYHPVGVRSAGEDVLLFGRLVPIKGFDEALAQLVRTATTVHVVGAGPEEPHLREIAARGQAAVKFWGWADAAGKREVFPRCGRALFPSRVQPGGRHEGWPVSVLEVAECGIVPFVGEWPGSAELVAHSAHQVVRDARWDQAAATPLAGLRESNVAWASQFTWDALAPRWVEWVERAVRTPRR